MTDCGLTYEQIRELIGTVFFLLIILVIIWRMWD